MNSAIEFCSLSPGFKQLNEIQYNKLKSREVMQRYAMCTASPYRVKTVLSSSQIRRSEEYKTLDMKMKMVLNLIEIYFNRLAVANLKKTLTIFKIIRKNVQEDQTLI